MTNADTAARGPAALPLSALHPDPLNPRRARSDKALKAMIAAIGETGERLRTPLLVRADGKGGWLVADGETRRLALLALEKLGNIAADHAVPVAVIEAASEAEIREAALSVNDRRFDLHPVEQVEAIANCDAAGMTTKEIAARLSLTEREVTQRRALGVLAPEIRDAWLEGALNDEAAAAFTLTDDQAQQVKVFAALKKSRRLHRWSIREALAGDTSEVRKLLKTVGVKAYEAAGGRVIRDLFAECKDDAAGVSDFGLLDRLAGEAVDRKIEALKAEGFAWADRAEKHPRYHGYDRAAAKTKAERAKCGAVVSVAYDGALTVTRGLVLPKAVKAAKKKSGAAAEAKALPFALVRALSVARTKALQQSVRTDTDLALRILVATLDWRAGAYFRDIGSPSTLTHSGWRDPREDGDDDEDQRSFEDCFAATAGISRADLLEAMADHVARSINMEQTVPYNAVTDGAAVIDACDEIAINQALDEAFDAAGYFAKAGKTAAIAAIADCERSLDASAIAALEKKKGPELAAIAADKAKAQRWLPAPLRYARYAGPAPRAAKAAKAKGAEPVPKPKHATKPKSARKQASS